jgi:hypothetical protein
MNKDHRRAIAEVWFRRCSEMDLRPGTKKRSMQLEAYLQGVLASLTTVNAMSHHECDQIFFLVYVGRGEETLERWAKVEADAVTT